MPPLKAKENYHSMVVMLNVLLRRGLHGGFTELIERL